MTLRVLLAAVLLSALVACHSDDGASARPAFRNLGKRGDSNLAGDRGGAAVR